MRWRYLEAVVAKDAEEGDDGVGYGQETEGWRHVSAPLLQNKANGALFSRVSRRLLLFLHLGCRWRCHLGSRHQNQGQVSSKRARGADYSRPRPVTEWSGGRLGGRDSTVNAVKHK